MMNPRKLSWLFSLLWVCLLETKPAPASPDDVWKLQVTGVSASLRGLCAISDACCWASGSQGTVIRTIDGGRSWLSVGPPNTDAADFRDIQAWDESTAVIMSAGDVDRLYRTEDGGLSWSVVYDHSNPAAFFDGMSFDQTRKHGWLMGDPIDGRVQLLTTDDSGRTWKTLPDANSPRVANGIAAFAASGTNLQCKDRESVLIGLGGADTKSTEHAQASVLMTANFGSEWYSVILPIHASSTAGVFSVVAVDGKHNRWIAVGGDYKKPEQNTDNIAISEDSGRTWRLPKTSRPNGFRSAVIAIPHDNSHVLLVATGPSGTDRSTDGGESWSKISLDGFHAISFVSKTVGWAAGSDGRVARWQPSR